MAWLWLLWRVSHTVGARANFDHDVMLHVHVDKSALLSTRSKRSAAWSVANKKQRSNPGRGPPRHRLLRSGQTAFLFNERAAASLGSSRSSARRSNRKASTPRLPDTTMSST